MMQSKRPPTIRDVAAAAGVSTAAVSKFVNGQQRFSPEVEARIRATVDSLGYRQNPLARSMVTGQTRTIGFAILNISNPYFTAAAKGAHRIAAANGYTLMVADTEREHEQPGHQSDLRILEALAGRVDGLLVSARLPADALQWLAAQHKPIVVFGRTRFSGVPSAAADPVRAAYILGRHLVEVGRRKIAYVGDPHAQWNADRLDGLRRALAEAGLQPIVHEAEGATLEAGMAAGSTVLLGGPRPDAVVGANDLVALGLLHAAHSIGIKVPSDVAFAGFDDIAFARYAYPPLTTVDTRSETVGEVAMTRLLAAMRGETVEGAVAIEPRLIPRDSTRQLGA
jgi:DNA-binding LacI/PurR family transcriptional regulator